MTLQKQSIFVLPLLMTTSMSSLSPSAKLNNDTIFEQRAVLMHDSTLPYFPTLMLSLSDSLQKPHHLALNAKPLMRMNTNAVKFVENFLKKNRKDLKEVGGRGKALFPVIESIFEKHGLPGELKYLAVVESDLKGKAHSSAGAVGYWQLMRETAGELGLKITANTDERKHLRKSTTAAAKYLKALYKEYDDWLLVIAAYNTGPGVVNKAIRNAGSRNFWRLQSHLPAETRGHVKRFIAVHYFFENAGSETTVTKAERLAHQKEVERFELSFAQTSFPDSMDHGKSPLIEEKK